MTSNGVVEKALGSLGRGFDVTGDFRMKFCKGKERLVAINEYEKKEIHVPGFGHFPDVSIDINCDKGDRVRYQTDILDFHQMSRLINERSSLAGKVPNGLFNVLFGFNSGTWASDARETQCLAMDGYFITLFNLRIDRYPLVLSDQVVNDVPSTWQPQQLARFIENYGTHVIVGVSVGGQDLVLVSQDQSSDLPPSELKKHLDKLGDQLFTGACTIPPLRLRNKNNKNKTPEAFNVFDPEPMLVDSFSSMRTKDGITVICSKRGGDTTESSHCEWLRTVPSLPDAINFSFIPITSLLGNGVPGKGYLSHAINLYLRYKPPIADLRYFLDFQSHKIWAPIHSDLPLGFPTNKAILTPALHFNLMGPKLYVNTTQVSVGKQPVTGMRLYLEGNKSNRLAVHLQHLSIVPVLLGNQTNDPSTSIWRGSDEVADESYFEAVQSKRFSHVCIAPLDHDQRWAQGRDAGFIVTGAQLLVKQHGPKNVLHLRLRFSKVSNAALVCRSVWEQGSSDFSQKSSFFSTISTSIIGSSEKEKQTPIVIIDSGVFPTGPPVPVQTQKLLKFVDTSQVCKGPEDSPGHWLVTGAKLDLEKGKISLHVKFSLLCSSSWE
ncbi:MACPF domain-containing protein At1g14780 [Aristolochia californica]|uniref:MACPF domain-containing protein At1g14780 n=1 Tax=Aristolochia californica TaxID=171875 RepID=UPI0035E0A66A